MCSEGINAGQFMWCTSQVPHAAYFHMETSQYLLWFHLWSFFFSFLSLQLPSWDIKKKQCLLFPDRGTEKNRDNNSTSLIYTGFRAWVTENIDVMKCAMKPAKISVDLAWWPTSCLHDSGVLAVYVAVAALDHARKSNLDVSSSSLRDQEAWMISLMLPVHIVKGLCLEDGLRGPSHCLGSMDLAIPSHLTTAWGGRLQVCTGTDILLNPQGFLK